jgi:putative addiction module component (TIGR02574 family)
MPMTKEQILAESMHLSRKDRDELAEQIRQSVSEGEFTPEDIAEFRRRVEAVERGEMQTFDGEEVMKELFAELTRAKAS